MIPLPIWLTNIQFVIGAFSTFAFFAAAWLNLDSWAIRKELKTGMRSFGFLLLALWSALHGIGSAAAAVTVISAAALALGSLCIAVSYVIDKAPSTPKELARLRGQQQEKIAAVMRGPKGAQPVSPAPMDTKPTAVATPAMASAAPTKLMAAPILSKKSTVPSAKPSPPAPGAPLTVAPGLVKPRPAKAESPAPNKMGFASPSLQAKAGLRTEAHVTMPKIAKRRRTRLLASLIALVILLTLAGGIAYLVITKTNLFAPKEVPQPILIETEEPAPGNVPASPLPSPTPLAEEAKETVTIRETETGSLNVREGASTTTPVVTRIAPGEEYELLEENEDGDWYKIQVDEDTAGWIATRYASKN